MDPWLGPTATAIAVALTPYSGVAENDRCTDRTDSQPGHPNGLCLQVTFSKIVLPPMVAADSSLLMVLGSDELL